MTYYSAIELTNALIRQKRQRSNTGSRSSAGLQSFSNVGRRYSVGSYRRFSPFFSDRFERRGLVYVGANINNPAQTQATNGSGYWQSHGSADWEPTLSVANGQPVSQTDALNNTTSYTYNSLGKVLTVTDAESNVTSYTYNLLGQMTSLTDPEGNATSWTYDSMGRVVSETNEKNAIRAYEYDDLGRLIQTTDRNGRVIQYEYDYLGRQTAEKWLDSNSAVIGSIEYTFDGNNNLLTVTDSISGTDYEYRYDALNRCVYTCIDAAELNSPVYLSYLYSNSDLTVTETLTGLINGIVAPYYQNVYQFDVFGRLESISQTGTGLTAKSVDYVYNLNGQRIRAEYQQNGIAVSESNWVYDVTGKVSSIQHKTASDAVFAEYDFTWDAGNRIIEIDSTDGTAEYTYDKTGQLTGAYYDYITDELYTYDSNGNRTNTGYVTGENNETLSDGVYRYSYDNEGNRTEKFLWTDTNNNGIIDASEKTLVQTYEWDYRNRLESVTNYENGIAKEVMDYLYDYLNLMIERTVTDAATSILQSSEYNLYSNGQVALEYDTTSSVDVVKSVNLWGANIDELVAVEQMAQSVNDSNVILWTYSDHLNSIRDVLIYDSITQTAAVVNHIIYNAFGVLVSSTDGAAVPVSISPLLKYCYTGKYFDDSTGLQNNINRWYDNTIGKWLSVDPIGFKGGNTNLFGRLESVIYFSDSKGQPLPERIRFDYLPIIDLPSQIEQYIIYKDVPTKVGKYNVIKHDDPLQQVLSDRDVSTLILDINLALRKRKWGFKFDPKKDIIIDNDIKTAGELTYRSPIVKRQNPFLIKYRYETQNEKLKLVIMHELYHVLYDIQENNSVFKLTNPKSDKSRRDKEYDGHKKAIVKNYNILLNSISDKNEKIKYCKTQNKNKLIESYSKIATKISLDIEIPRNLSEEDKIVINFFTTVFNGVFDNSTGKFTF